MSRSKKKRERDELVAELVLVLKTLQWGQGALCPQCQGSLIAIAADSKDLGHREGCSVKAVLERAEQLMKKPQKKGSGDLI